MTTQQNGPVLCAFGLAGIPLISPGDDLAAFILTALQTSRLEVQQDDVLVIAQKVVSRRRAMLFRSPPLSRARLR